MDIEKWCSECRGSLVLDEYRGDLVCSRCGLVLKEKRIDFGQEWRAYTTLETQTRSRTGGPITCSEDLLMESTLETQPNRDSKGNLLSPNSRNYFLRLARLDRRAKSNRIKNLRTAYREIARLTSLLGLPDLIGKTAGIIYRQALKLDLIRGRSIEKMAETSVYLACREIGIPISLKDIDNASPQTTFKELSRYVRTLILLMNFRPKPANLNVFVYSLGEKMKLSMETRSLAVRIIELARKNGLVLGRSPMAIAGAALYIAGLHNNERRKQIECAKASNSSPITIRNRYKEMLPYLTDLLKCQH